MNVSVRQFDQPGYVLTKPLPIGEFSSHANLEITPDASNCRHLINVKPDFEPLFDLNQGFKNHFDKNPKFYLNDLVHLQEWALSQRAAFSDVFSDYGKVFRHAEIVCARGTITDIGKTPFNSVDKWRIVARRAGDVIYLHNCGAVDGKTFVISPGDDPHLTYWGHSFQRAMTSKSKEIAILGGFDDSERVDCRETYSVVFRADLIQPGAGGGGEAERVKLAYSAEIKAVDEGFFVDFRTVSSHLFTRGGWLKKAWFWWLQDHFVNVDRVHVGFRSALGIVHTIRVIDRAALRREAGAKPRVSMCFLTRLLQEVKRRCEDCLQISYCPVERRVAFSKPQADTDFLLPEFTDKVIKTESD